MRRRHALEPLGLVLSRDAALRVPGTIETSPVAARDLVEVCDTSKTDLAVHARPGEWYRERLGKYFATLGCGLHYRKGGRLVFYELEQAGP